MNKLLRVFGQYITESFEAHRHVPGADGVLHELWERKGGRDGGRQAGRQAGRGEKGRRDRRKEGGREEVRKLGREGLMIS